MRQCADMKRPVVLVTPAVPVNLTLKTRGGRTWIVRADGPRMHPGRRKAMGTLPGPKPTGAIRRRVRDGLPVHSFAMLLDDLSTLILDTVRVAGTRRDVTFETSAKSTEVQERALELLGVDAAVAGASHGVCKQLPGSIRRRTANATIPSNSSAFVADATPCRETVSPYPAAGDPVRLQCDPARLSCLCAAPDNN